jgi:hypothetical protein
MAEGSDPIQAHDINGNPITVGSYVLYLNTGSAGQVTELKQEEGTIWALMDTTGLYYNVEVLVITDATAVKVKKEREAGEVDKAELARQQAPERVVDIGQVTGGG